MNRTKTKRDTQKKARKGNGELWNLRLYIAGETARSIAALRTLQ